ncbi:efflux RND transporter periplasmic adaptor subunit [Terriglobus aquaticus]
MLVNQVCSRVHRVLVALAAAGVVLLSAGCHREAPPAAAAAMQAMPVQVSPVQPTNVPESDTYVATVKSRRSSTMQPQVDGNVTKILVKSGDHVRPGQVLMQIDPLKQVAAVQAQQAAEIQTRAQFQYNQSDLQRQKQLFEAGVISRQAYDQAVQNMGTSQGAFTASQAQTSTQRTLLSYYQIRAPFAGVVGDIPVHIGDYVSPTTLLTTVDQVTDLEAYIYLPTDRAADAKTGLPVELLNEDGKKLASSSIYFVSPEVDNGLQGILAKAPVPANSNLRNGQILNARVTWQTRNAPVVPVLAVTRIGGLPFVFVAQPSGNGFIAHQKNVQLGEPVGNNYPVLGGLSQGDKVIVSGLQMLQEGMPVKPLG